ncbi:MAG TPA: POTRA domain-containing protein [Candidatus Acidoferrum sp.]|jgi:outer membrane protein assembly factor BamA
MPGCTRTFALALFLSALVCSSNAEAQTPPAPAAAQNNSTAVLREIKADGLKSFTNEQVAALSGLQIGQQVGRDDLQGGADKLVQSGVFAHVKYNFQSRADGIVVTFHLEEADRMPAYFDNLPWFTDGELNDAIRAKINFYNGTLPGAGAVVEQASDAVSLFLATHGLQAAVEHQVVANPNGEGSVQEFHIEGGSLSIEKMEFSDASLNTSKTVQQQLAELKGKPYSRMAIDLFLTEQIRPIYQKQGYLRAKLGPPEIRLTGNPNQKLPEKIPVFVPVAAGSIYKFKGVEWTGNSLLSTTTLSGDLGLKDGDVADGMALEAGFDRIREEYAHVGYLEAKIDPVSDYDDQAHTVSYRVRIEEGGSYKFNNLTITGLSPGAEKRLRDAWSIPQGEVFDKTTYEDLLTKLETKPADIFGKLAVHYDNVGHWVQPDDANHTVDVLLDFK